MNSYWQQALKFPPDRPTILCIAGIVIGLVFGILFVVNHLRGVPLPPMLRWRRAIILKIVFSRQFWFAAAAGGLIFASASVLIADAFDLCTKTSDWSWECKNGGTQIQGSRPPPAN